LEQIMPSLDSPREIRSLRKRFRTMEAEAGACSVAETLFFVSFRLQGFET